MRTILLLAALALGCAHASSPECSTWALGKGANASCYGPLPGPPAPVLLPEDSVVIEERRQDIDRTFPASDEKRVTKITRPAVAEPSMDMEVAGPPLVQRSEGAAISEAVGGVLRLMARTAWQAIKSIFGAPIP